MVTRVRLCLALTVYLLKRKSELMNNPFFVILEEITAEENSLRTKHRSFNDSRSMLESSQVNDPGNAAARREGNSYQLSDTEK